MRFLVNDQPTDCLPVTDRGLAYGDGLFETMLVKDNHVILAGEHLKRLIHGCRRLGLNYQPGPALFQKALEFHKTLQTDSAVVVKVIITRGAGGRGYSPHNVAKPTEIIGLFPTPQLPDELYVKGTDIRILTTPCSQNPSFAGMKHLCRLEQVMASAELNEGEFEGIMPDMDGNIVEGTKTNILYRRRGQWFTPTLTMSGIKGVLREHILASQADYGLKVAEKDISQAECASIEAMALINSVVGVVPVKSLANIALDVDCVRQEVQQPIHQKIPFRVS